MTRSGGNMMQFYRYKSYCSYNKIVALDCIIYIILQLTKVCQWLTFWASIFRCILSHSSSYSSILIISSHPWSAFFAPRLHSATCMHSSCADILTVLDVTITLVFFFKGSDWLQTRLLQFGPHHTYRKYTEMAHVLCSETPIRQLSFEISPLWFPLIGKEINCYLGQVSCFYHVMCFVLVLTSTHSVCWSFKLLTILAFIDSFYILHDHPFYLAVPT